MREDDLRGVLLVRAIEETDRDGTLLPAADRTAASRTAKRSFENVADAGSDALIAHRARTLLAQVTRRHPFVVQVLAHAGGARWMAWCAIALALAAGVMLSALDGTRRINVLAFPLLALVAWNFAVYAWILAGWMRTRPRHSPREGWLRSLALDAAIGRVGALVSRSKRFDAVLAAALTRFVAEWQEAARPLLHARVALAFHLAAAAVGIGLIAGLYARGIVFAYQAGWESTFLDAAGARTWLATLYGPASAITGIAIPEGTHLESIRWRDGAGGESAGRWIHLLAATAALYVVLPRVGLALVAAAASARRSRSLAAPPSLGAYSRLAFSGVGGLSDRGLVMVAPHAYEPTADSLARLRTLLAAEMGEQLKVRLHAPLPHGGEDAFIEALRGDAAPDADVMVLLVSLATTPEDENQGALITALRDWIERDRPRAELVVMVDEGPYAQRMDPSRVAERHRLWQGFIAARGVEARFTDLSR